MTMRLLPNPSRLIVTVNGRTYTGTLNIPYDNIIDADGQMLAANGWTVLTPQPGEEDVTALAVANTANTTANTGNTTANTANTTATTANTALTTIGAYVSASVLANAAVPLVTGNASTVASANLPAGTWDVSGTVVYHPESNTAVTYLTAGVGITANTAVNASNRAYQYPSSYYNTDDYSMVTPDVRITLGNATVVGIVAQADFANNSLSAYGIFRATRATRG